MRALCEGSASGAALAEQYPAFLRYDRRGVRAALRFYGAGELPAALLDWALGLTRLHMSVSCLVLLARWSPGSLLIAKR